VPAANNQRGILRILCASAADSEFSVVSGPAPRRV